MGWTVTRAAGPVLARYASQRRTVNGIAVSLLIVACGGASAPADDPSLFANPTVPDARDTSADGAPGNLGSPHSAASPPEATHGEATLKAHWWTADEPCPEGARLKGGPPPSHFEVHCQTEKDKNQGPMTRFHPTGAKAEDGHYDNHFATGVWTRWDPDGNKLTETPYVDGEKHGIETEWYPEGKIKSQRRYQHGTRSGLTEIWDETGRKRSAIEYEDGKQHGAATYWNEKGQVVRVEEWERGARVKLRKP